MNKEEIGRIINPQYPWVYAPTTAPTKLIMSDGSIKVGYFQFVKLSSDIERSNKFTFVEFGENAQYYKATGDESYITIIDGNELVAVEYPSYTPHDVSLESVVRRIDNLKAEFDKNGITIKHLLRTILHFRLDWGFQKPAISSADYTVGATKQILLEGLSEHTYLSDSRSMDASPNKIITLFNELIVENILTKELLSDLHKLIFKSEGQFRNHEVTVHQRVPSEFAFASPKDIDHEIDELIAWYKEQSNDTNFHPLFLASIFHYRLVSIHPFSDGNGRLARIITSVIFLRNRFPPPIVTLEDRVFYLDSLQRADSGDIEAWIKFLGKKMINSMESLLSSN